MRAINQNKSKTSNRNLITRLIIINQPISRIRLSKLTGLTKMTVTNIVNELLEENIIEEGEPLKASEGRRPIGLRIKTASVQIIGIYIARSSLSVFKGDISGNIFKTLKKDWSAETNDSMSQKIIETVEEIDPKGAVAISVSSIGPLDGKNKIILNPPNFYEVKNLPLGEILNKHFHLPIYLENDMKASALAEKYFGNAKKLENFIYLGISNGIGSGIIGHNKLFLGENGFSGEIGHTTVDADGPLCRCGNNGCLELYVSVPRSSEQITKERLHAICKYLSIGCINLINLFNPSHIFLGHKTIKLGENFPKLLNESIENRYISRGYNNVEISFSRLGDKSPIYGAIALYIHHAYH